MTITPQARGTFALLFVLVGSVSVLAQATSPLVTPVADAKPSDVLVDRPDADPDSTRDLLGQAYESKGHGIALRPPKDAVPVRRLGAKEFIEFVDDARGWSMKVSKIMLNKPGSLADVRDAQGTLHPGVMEFTAKRLKEEIPDAEFLRKEIVNIGDGDVGMLALRYTKNLKPVLAQQAIIQKTDQLYYLLALTTPGAPKGTKDTDPAAHGERIAVETFRQVLDSVKLLDLAHVKADQDARLFRTRGLLVNLTSERLRAALQPQRWTRILKNGKDVGYSYFQETTTLKGAQEGIEVRLRTRVVPGQDVQVDSGTIMFASMDIRHEDWSTLTATANVKARAANKEYNPPQIAEFGISDRRSIPGEGDVYNLQVQFEATGGANKLEPVVRELPPFYLPQVMSHLLPRLVPLGEPKTFMFAMYVPETREVMARYVDVLAPKKLEWNKQMVRAVPVEDRIGLEGPLTTHYMSIDGKWLGSETKETGITVIPSDEEQLLKLWKDAILTAPEAPPARKAQPEDAPAAADNPRPARSGKSAAGGTDSSRKAARQRLGVGSSEK
jgi:hypothetical protein